MENFVPAQIPNAPVRARQESAPQKRAMVRFVPAQTPNAPVRAR